MAKLNYAVQVNVVRYPGMAGWHFAAVPKPESTTIKAAYGAKRPGFGSIRVEATIGTSTWLTSIFPDKASGRYLLPIKASVRKKEDLGHGDTCRLTLKLRP